MAAITRVRPSLVTPAGEARIRRGEAAVDILKGQAVGLVGAASSGMFESRVGLAANEGAAIGIALKDAYAGEVAEFVIDGEVGGYAGLTPGAKLSVINGNIDSTAATGATRFIAYNATTVILV